MATDETLQTPDPANITGSSGAAGTSFNDSVFRIQSTVDITKKVQFDVSAVATATTRIIVVPDKDITLGQTDFEDNVFRISDDSDNTKKIAFQASSITSGQTRTITMPDSDVDLGLIGSGGGPTFTDDVFRVQDNLDNTKQIAFEASLVGPAVTRTITMPDNDVDLSLVGQTDFSDLTFAISNDVDDTRKIQFDTANISTSTTRFITMPDNDVNLSLVGNNDFEDNVFRISDDADNTRKIAFDAGGIAAGNVRTITMPDNDVDLGLVGSGSGPTFDDDVFRINDNLDNTKQIAFDASLVGPAVTRTIIMPDNDVDLSLVGSGSGPTFDDDVFRINDDVDNTKQIAFEASNISSAITRTITMPDADVDLSLVGQTDFSDLTFAISNDVDDTRKIQFDTANISTSTTRFITMPDNDVNLSLVGNNDFEDNVFRISDDADNTRKIAFDAGGIAAGNVRTITMPDNDVDLGLVGGSELSDATFRVVDDGDNTKKIAFQASGITSGQTRTITMPDADVDLSLVGSGSGPTFDDDVFRINDDVDNTKQIAFEASNISSAITRTITMPDADVDLSLVGQTDFSDLTFAISNDVDDTRKIQFDTANISTSTTRFITMPDNDVDLSLVGNNDFEDNVFRISDNTDNTKKLAFEVSAITTSTTRTITVPDSDITLGQTEFNDNVFRINDDVDNTKQIAFEASNISSAITRTITMPDADVDLSLVGQTDFNDNVFRINDDVDNTKQIAFEASNISSAVTRTIIMPDADVNLTNVGPDITDDVFRISDDVDNTKKIAFEVSAITTSTTRTITVPDSDVTLGQTDFEENVFRVSNDIDNTKKIRFDASNITTSSTRAIVMPDNDVDLTAVGQTDFVDFDFRISDDVDLTKKIAFEASNITSGQTRTITMPDSDVDLGLIGSGSGPTFDDDVFRINDDVDNTKQIAFEASAITTGTVRTITMPDADVDLGLIGGSELVDNTFRIVDDGDNTKKVAFEVSAITTSTTRTITVPDQNVDLERLYVLPDPTLSSDPSNKNYVDTQIAGPSQTIFTGNVDIENIDEPTAFVFDVDTTIVRATDTALTNVTYSSGALATLSSDVNGSQVIDGAFISEGAIILVKDQTNLEENGIYKMVHRGGANTGWVMVKLHPKSLGNDYKNGYITNAMISGASNIGKKFILNTTSGSLSSAPTVDYSTEDQEWEEFKFDTNNDLSDIQKITTWDRLSFSSPVSVLKTKTDVGEEFTSTTYSFNGTFMRLTGTLAGSSLGGVSISTGDFILVDQQTALEENGVYRVINTSWTLEKLVPAPSTGIVSPQKDYRNGMIAEIDSASGSTFSGNLYILNTPSGSLNNSPIVRYINDGSTEDPVINTDDFVWEQFQENVAISDLEQIEQYFLSNSSSTILTKTDSALNIDYFNLLGFTAFLADFTSNGAIGSIGGITPSLEDQILVTEESPDFENGIYQVLFTGGPNNPFVLGKKRPISSDADYINGQFVNITSGTFSGEDHMLSTPIGSLASPPNVDYRIEDQIWQEYTTTIKNNLTDVDNVAENSVILRKVLVESPDELEINVGGALSTDGFTKILTINTAGLTLNTGTLDVGINDITTSSGNLSLTSGNLSLTSGNLSLTSGNIAINESNPTEQFHITQTSQNTNILLENQSTTATDSNRVILRRNRGSSTRIVGGDNVGKITAEAFDGENNVETASIEFDTTGTISTNIAPGLIKFSTRPDLISNSTERMRINEEGFVGIGTTNPVALLNVANTLGNAAINIQAEDNSESFIDFTNNSFPTLRFRLIYDHNISRFIATSPTANILSIDDLNQRVGIGLTSSDSIDSNLHIKNSFSSGNNTNIIIENDRVSSTNTSRTTFRKSRNGGIITSGDILGELRFTGDDGSNNIESALIQVETTGTIGTDRIPSIIKFYTHPDFQTSIVERLRINEDGFVGINQTTPLALLHVTDTAGIVPTKIIIESSSTGTSQLSLGDTADPDIGSIGYDNANDVMIFTTNGSEQVRINEDGFVGINQTAPESLLHITDTIGTPEIIIQSAPGGTSLLSMGDTVFTDVGSIAYSNASNSMIFTAGGSERVRINNSGFVGINQTTPLSLLHVANTVTEAKIIVESSSTGISQLSLGDTADPDIGAIGYDNDNDVMIFTTNGSEQARIDDSGNFGINETNPEGLIHITDPTSNTRFIIENQSTTSNISGRTIFRRNRTGGVVNAGDCVGQLLFQGNDGTNDIVNASIQVDVPSTSTVATDRVAGNIIFSTHPDSTTNRIERLRIEENGFIGINEPDPEDILHITCDTGNTTILLENQENTAGNSSRVFFRRNNGGGVVNSGDEIARLVFQGNDGTSDITSAIIEVDTIGSIAANQVPGSISFLTHPDSPSSADLRLRIRESGNIGINEGNPQSLLHITDTTGTPEVIIQSSPTGTSKLSMGDGADLDAGGFRYNNNTNTMTITTDSTDVATIDSDGVLAGDNINLIYTPTWTTITGNILGISPVNDVRVQRLGNVVFMSGSIFSSFSGATSSEVYEFSPSFPPNMSTTFSNTFDDCTGVISLGGSGQANISASERQAYEIEADTANNRILFRIRRTASSAVSGLTAKIQFHLSYTI